MDMDEAAYVEGKIAYLSGVPESANPYAIDGNEDDHIAWNDGWNIAATAAEAHT